MGKNRVIKSLGEILRGMIAHKILLKYTNKPESINHLQSEIDNYRENALETFKKYNWNSNDKERIKKEALKNLKNEFKKPHFNDVKFPIEEAEKLIKETLNEII